MVFLNELLIFSNFFLVFLDFSRFSAFSIENKEVFHAFTYFLHTFPKSHHSRQLFLAGSRVGRDQVIIWNFPRILHFFADIWWHLLDDELCFVLFPFFQIFSGFLGFFAGFDGFSGQKFW